MKKQTKQILKQAGFSDWAKSLRDSVSDLTGGKPALQQKDVEKLDKFKKQMKFLSDQLNSTIKEMEDLGLEGNWGLQGQEGETTLANAAKYLKHFSDVLNNTQYEIVHEKPAETVK